MSIYARNQEKQHIIVMCNNINDKNIDFKNGLGSNPYLLKNKRQSAIHKAIKEWIIHALRYMCVPFTIILENWGKASLIYFM